MNEHREPAEESPEVSKTMSQPMGNEPAVRGTNLPKDEADLEKGYTM
jgi:hypothetical protein